MHKYESFLISDLNIHLDNIAEDLISNYPSISEIGVLNGISGVGLFFYYYGRFSNKTKYYGYGEDVIHRIIERINEGYSLPTFCSGICGAAWFIQHLSQNDFVDLDVNGLLGEFDDFLLLKMTEGIKSGNFDFLHASTGYGFYFLKRYNNISDDSILKSKYAGYINELLIAYEKKIISEEGEISWFVKINTNKETEVINIGLSHGLSSVLLLLCRISKCLEFRNRCLSLIDDINREILKFEQKKGIYKFPMWVAKNNGEIDHQGRVAWCYGDLGLSIALYQSAIELNNRFLTKKAIEVLHNLAAKNDLQETAVVDAGFCHGAYGNMHIFDFFYKKAKSNKFRVARDFWLNEGFKMIGNDPRTVDYQQWKPSLGQWKKEYSLLEGTSGIGLCLISLLSETDLSWDECLLLH